MYANVKGGQYRTSAQTAKLPYWTSHFAECRLKFLTFINMSTKGAQTEGMVCAGYPLSCERDVKTHNAGSWGRSPTRLTPPPELGREGWPGAPTVFWGRDDHHETSLTNSNSFSSKQVHPSSPFYIKTHHFAPKNFHSSQVTFPELKSTLLCAQNFNCTLWAGLWSLPTPLFKLFIFSMLSPLRAHINQCLKQTIAGAQDTLSTHTLTPLLQRAQ